MKLYQTNMKALTVFALTALMLAPSAAAECEQENECENGNVSGCATGIASGAAGGGASGVYCNAVLVVNFQFTVYGNNSFTNCTAITTSKAASCADEGEDAAANFLN